MTVLNGVVEDVIVVPGKDFGKGWKHDMFEIYMNDGERYIDNTVNHIHAHWVPANWMELKGKKITAKVVYDSGQQWLQLKG